MTEISRASQIDYRGCFIIVSYGVDPIQCKTLNSLINGISGAGHEKLCIVIWNNGPQIYGCNRLGNVILPEGCDLLLFEDVNNKPLSKIYNYLIDHVSSRFFCILDHDSDIDKSYLDKILDFQLDFMVPRIVAKGEVRGPKLNGRLITEDGFFVIGAPNSFFAIASGMCIGYDLMMELKSRYGNVFDERYALYGVDTSFCIRLSSFDHVRSKKIYCGGQIFHSLSRLEKEDKRSKKFRSVERAFDVGITLRNYFSIYWILASLKWWLKSLKDGNFPIRPFVYALIKGRHPRAEGGGYE